MPKVNNPPFNIVLFGIGLALIALGVGFMINPSISLFVGHSIDIAEHKHIIATLCIGIGVYSFWSAFTVKSYKGNEIYICPSCEWSGPIKDLSSNHCPKCRIEMEPLKGFYKRHPELADKKAQEGGNE